MRVTLVIVWWFATAFAAGCGGGGAQGPDPCEPSDEVCNGQDDDCDGLTDEDLVIDADGDGHQHPDSCGEPRDDCDDTDPEVYPGHPEVPYFCDGKDNDCDGLTDEDCECDPGPPPEERPCSTDEGACRAGVEVCEGSGVWGLCSGILPEDEICDGKDNDCDGVTDDVENPPACELDEGVCTGVQRDGCAPCDYGPDYEQNESRCDRLDNDCDGMTDEDLPPDTHEPNESCHTPAPQGTLDEGDSLGIEGTLYAFAGGVPGDDEDWYRLELTEDDHLWDCTMAGGDGSPQCHELRLELAPPEGADHQRWEVCVVDGIRGTCEDFGDPALTSCSTEVMWDAAAGSYLLVVRLEGACGQDDGGNVYLLVRGRQAPVSDCRSYWLDAGLSYFGTVACP